MLFTGLSPRDFYLFTKLNSRVKGYHFQIFDRVQNFVTEDIKTLTKADFLPCYEAWKFLWTKFVASEGCYFEGGKS
jgi:hypothetical protein